MSYRIFITGSGIAEEAQQFLREQQCTFEIGDPSDTPEHIARKLETFQPDGLIVRQGKITGEVLDASKKLKVICKHGVGIDNIDVEAATKRGMPVMFTPGANSESVAEHTLSLILALLRRIPVQDRRIRDGIFDKKQYDGQELLGKTLGLIGFGRIGRRLAELVAPFKIKIIVFDPYCEIKTPQHHLSQVKTLDEILPQADILSIHCPLTSETKGMINEDTIVKMKQGVYIINTARGGIVNENDLLKALKNKQVSGAALDVFEVEPPAVDNQLFNMDNIILTTHIGGISDNSFKNMGMSAVKNVLAVLKGDAIDKAALVNKELVEKFPNIFYTPNP